MEPIILNGRYRLLELVGTGGMAAVYRGVDTLLQRQVAVKVLHEAYASDPAFLARFQREARAAANLDHPNIVTVYDVGQDGDRHYIVMEYVNGQDLKSLIRRKGRLTVGEALDIAVQIAAGVGHAHKAGIIHCDVKPQNVLVTNDGRAKVTDFGIARALSESGITESDTVWGSPLYFSPEQAAGDPPTPASDVYSIGIVMYEMLTGIPPFQAEKPAALALMHMREEPTPLPVHAPQVPPQLEWIVRKLLAKEPSARYRNAEQLAHVLEEYRRQSVQLTGFQPVGAVQPPPSPTPRSSAAAPRRAATETMALPPPSALSEPLTWILGIIAVIAVLGLIPIWVAVYRDWSAPPPAPPLPPTFTPTPLVTFTPSAPTIPAPDVVGKSPDEARALVERAGLRFVVQETRDDRNALRNVVLEQSPAAGAALPLGAEIAVIVNGPGRELITPRLLDYPIDLVRDGLQSDGLRVVTETVWSAKPVGMILAQQPEPGTVLHSGDAVTLTVSGGVDVPIPIEVNLANIIALESVDLRQASFRPGDALVATLRWRSLRATSTPYVVFVHLIGPNGLVAQDDSEPDTPTTSWTAGFILADSHQVDIPANVPPGVYQLRVGMYPQGNPAYRLEVVEAGKTSVESNSILITEIEIKP